MTDVPPDLHALIAELEQQEQHLQFTTFDNDDAWALGCLIVNLAKERGLPLTVDIRRHGPQLFHAALPGTTPQNDTWIERKNRVVDRFSSASYLEVDDSAPRAKRLTRPTALTPCCTPLTAVRFPYAYATSG
jgi:uncharacterized protein (UPF0303 family)